LLVFPWKSIAGSHETSPIGGSVLESRHGRWILLLFLAKTQSDHRLLCVQSSGSNRVFKKFVGRRFARGGVALTSAVGLLYKTEMRRGEASGSELLEVMQASKPRYGNNPRVRRSTLNDDHVK
jgi:hypothetical protein